MESNKKPNNTDARFEHLLTEWKALQDKFCNGQLTYVELNAYMDSVKDLILHLKQMIRDLTKLDIPKLSALLTLQLAMQRNSS